MSDYPALDPAQWAAWDEFVQLNSWWDIPARQADEFHNSSYHGAFVPQIPQNMILRYTQPYDVVADLMMGHGTTGIESVLLGRHFIGNDISKPAFDYSSEVIGRAQQQSPDIESYLYHGDYRDLDLNPQSINLTMFHPPYLDIVKFSEEPGCWANQPWANWQNLCLGFAQKLINATVDKGHLVLVIGDVWDSEWSCLKPLAFDTCSMFRAAGWQLRAIMVKNMGETKAKGKNTNLYKSRCMKHGTCLYGHEYVFIFRNHHTFREKNYRRQAETYAQFPQGCAEQPEA